MKRADDKRLLLLGLGYTARRLARRLLADGWATTAVNRTAMAGAVGFDDPVVPSLIATAPYILSSVPPDGEGDPVLRRWEAALAAAGPVWLGYLSSTAVYGDTQGQWVDEAAPTGSGRRTLRTQSDARWQALGAHVFRLPGIYGPGRSPFDRLRDGTARLIDKPGHVFCRIHVDDIVTTLMASMRQPVAGGRIYNVADDEPAESRVPIIHAAGLLGMAPPPLVAYADARLPPAARGFYTECRRVRALRIREELGVRLAYPSYREGLAAILDEEKAG